MCCGDMVEAAGATVCICCGATCDDSRPAGQRSARISLDGSTPGMSQVNTMRLMAADLMSKVRAAPGDIVPALSRSLETRVQGFAPHDAQPTSEAAWPAAATD